MKYSKMFSKKSTPQSEPIPSSGQVANSAGGYAWQIDTWALLDRFLILGTEAGTYYINAPKLTRESATNVIACLKADGERTVRRIVEVSVSGRAPKNDHAIFALALASSFGDDATRSVALSCVPQVCRTGTHLFAFAAACEGLRGWGRGLRKAIGRWYNAMDPSALEYQAVKYAQREGWSHRDLLRLGHPVPPDTHHSAIYKWIVDGELPAAESGVELPLVEATLRLREASADDAARIIRECRVPREAVPTELLGKPQVWEALLEGMPMTALVRNLATLTRVGLLVPGSDTTRKVVDELGNAERIRRARVHPMAMLIALRTYASGRGLLGKGTWTVTPAIVDALDAAFYTAFESVEPTGKRYLLGVDVSGSMGWTGVAGLPMMASEAAAAMAMVTVATEDAVTPMAFGDTFRSLSISRRMRLDDAMKLTRDQTFGRTDCALPMLFALEKKLKIDVFVVYTDNETWFGEIHPSQALLRYREKTGIAAKLIVMGMASNGFSIADPRDPGMLDVVGFDAAVPSAMAEFVRS